MVTVAAATLLLLCGLLPRDAAALLAPPAISTAPLSVPHRLLHGPGPSTAHPRVLASSSLPMLGHMHPEFSAILLDASAWLRYAFQARSPRPLDVLPPGSLAWHGTRCSSCCC
jgi:alanine-glyoxylate transaminase/serine-glyoxylate transaminase/serine-pyruvate transaminase